MTPHEASGTDVIYGLHAAAFALANPRRKVLSARLTENAARRLDDALAARPGLQVTTVTPRDLDRLTGPDAVHQGVLLTVEPLETLELDALMESACASSQPIVILDQVTDPHNVGAVLRSCAVFGAAGLLMTERHSPPLGATLAKSASGALDLLPVCLVRNLAKAMEELKAQGFHVIGLDGEASNGLLDVALNEATNPRQAFAFGAEGKGLRALTRDTCAEICRIGTDGPIASLNVSNAAAITLHLAALNRRTRAAK